MTATLAAPTTVRRPDRLELLRELSLVAVTAASVLTLGRLFDGTDHLSPLLLHTLLAHGLVVVMRRRGFGLGTAALCTVAGAGLAVAVVHYPDTTTLGVPSTETVDLLRADLGAAWSQFGDLAPPTPPLVGFLVASALAIWGCAFVADWAAFRLDVPLEAALPAATIFLFVAILGDERGRVPATAAMTATVLFFVLLQRVSRQARTGRWVTEDRRRGVNALIGVGAVLVLVSVVSSALVGPTLPGAESAPIVDLDPEGRGPDSRTTISPLVDIRRRLVDQSNIEVFSVTSPVRSYWRLTSLDTFDGRIWSSSGSYGKADGSLPAAVDSADVNEVARQEFSIFALAAIWLPAAFEPRSVASDVDLRYDETSATLIVDTDIANSDGIVYTVESALPRFDAAALSEAGTLVPREIVEGFSALPPDFSPFATQLANDIVAGSPTNYEAALRLQNHFRDNFTYDLSVPEGHSDNDLERFLFEDPRGYCEQFAGAYAALARSVGLPARVAVGFTPGEQSVDGVFIVRGQHAHAWPEVYFAGSGWVPFEPTPGRGAPFAENYTGVPEQQVDAADPSTATTLPAVPTTLPGETPATLPEFNSEVETNSPDAATDTNAGDSGLQTWVKRVLGVLAVVLGVALLYITLVPAIHLIRRRRRRRGPDTPSARVQRAWADSLDELSTLGMTSVPTATHIETATRAASFLPAEPELPHRVARHAEAVVYAPSGVDEDAATDAEEVAGAIAVAVRQSTSFRQRAGKVLDPRPFMPTRSRRRTRGH